MGRGEGKGKGDFEQNCWKLRSTKDRNVLDWVWTAAQRKVTIVVIAIIGSTLVCLVLFIFP